MEEVREQYYKKYISDQEIKSSLMPLVHMCDCYTFRQIFTTKKILPTDCKVFKKKLAYYFYGRPSYRVSDACEASGSISMFPVCFIIDPQQLDKIENAYPFDTGAFQAGLFESYFHKESSVFDFEFVQEYDFINKFVGYFYGSNKNYYDGVTAIDKGSIPTFAFELQYLHQIINADNFEKFDDRCQTLEIQTADEVNITAGGVMAMVLPAALMNEPAISSFLMDYDIHPITYTSTRCSPSALTSVIIAEVRKFYEEGKVI